MDKELKEMVEIAKKELWKYSKYSAKHGHEVINVTPKGASIDIATALQSYMNKKVIKELNNMSKEMYSEKSYDVLQTRIKQIESSQELKKEDFCVCKNPIWMQNGSQAGYETVYCRKCLKNRGK